MLRTCVRCGTPYISVCPTAKYCVSCRPIVRRELSLARYHKVGRSPARNPDSITIKVGPVHYGMICFGCPLQGWECRTSVKPPCNGRAKQYLDAVALIREEDVYA